MQQLKQLLPIGNKPAVRHCLDTILASSIRDIIVVLGLQGQEIEKLISGYPVKVLFNTDPRSEMADSVRIGLEAVDDAATGVMVCLADHPLVSPDTVWTIARLHSEKPGQIIIPSFNNRRGHPTLFPKNVLQALSPEKTLRDIIQENPGLLHLFETGDEGVILDMDTPEEYQRLILKMNERTQMNR